jgi:hypothetical protein
MFFSSLGFLCRWDRRVCDRAGSGEEAYAETPYWPAMSLLRSVSTLAKASLPGELCDVASCSKTGDIALHGPHLFISQ